MLCPRNVKWAIKLLILLEVRFRYIIVTFGSIPIKNLVDVLDIFIIDMYLYACIGMYILP